MKFIKGYKGIFPSINLKITEHFKHQPNRCKLQHLVCLLNRSPKRTKQGVLMEEELLYNKVNFTQDLEAIKTKPTNDAVICLRTLHM